MRTATIGRDFERELTRRATILVTDTGLLMAKIGPVALHVLSDVNAASFDRYLVEGARMIDLARDDERLVSVSIIRAGVWWSGLSLGERLASMRRFSEMVKQREEKMNRVTAAGILCPESTLARVAIRTALVFVPLGYPNTTVSRVELGWGFAKRCVPSLAEADKDCIELVRWAVNHHCPPVAHLL